MFRDPFYEAIIARLNGELDDKVFEACAADILREYYPTLVPISGGDDSGMDGAVADGKGLPFPLVTTTRKDVIGNLTHNLKKYVEDRGTRRTAILATSRSLTPRRRFNLEERAKESGFVLEQIYAQDAIALLLYHRPEWCRALLNLVGAPSALSKIPVSRRRFIDIDLVGRENDLVWLRGIDGDALLVGQPGSGKTFLLSKLIKDEPAYFLIDKELGHLANAIRAHRPSTIVVDDAQTDIDFLVQLRHLREELGADFRIVATSWNGDKDSVINALDIPEVKTHTLELLTLDEMAEIVSEVGIQSHSLVQEIVEQAQGKPGLAVTLADLCIRGSIDEIRTAGALTRSIFDFYTDYLSSKTSGILGVFALGGEAGMERAAVADKLGLDLFELRDVLIKLADGGILKELNSDFLMVQPEALRHALIRDVFFSRIPLQNINDFLQIVPNPKETTRTLIGAKSRGANVPEPLLQEMLEEQKGAYFAAANWRHYAWLGRDQVEWVLETHPEKLTTVAVPALHLVPYTVLPLLFEQSVGEIPPLHSSPEHPLRIIADWVKSGTPGTSAPLERRMILFEATRTWILSGGDTHVAIRTLAQALSPEFDAYYPEPGSGDTIRLLRGYLTENELERVEQLWIQAKEFLPKLSNKDAVPFIELLREWAYPRDASPNVMIAMDRTAQRLINDSIEIARNNPGIAHELQEIVDNRRWEIVIPRNHAFNLLYPQDNDLDERDFAKPENLQAIQQLAREWIGLEIDVVVTQIMAIEQTARDLQITWPRLVPYLAEQLSALTTSQCAWIKIINRKQFDTDFIRPFLYRAATTNEDQWVKNAIECLDKPILGAFVAEVALTIPNPPAQLINAIWTNLEKYAGIIHQVWLQDRLSKELMLSLLQHPSAVVACEAVISEWAVEPKGHIRAELRQAWENAVVEKFTETRNEFWLCEILKAEPAIAFQWLLKQATTNPRKLYQFGKAITSAASGLNTDQRIALITQLPSEYNIGELVDLVVGSDLNAYAALLANKTLKDFHLAPLHGELSLEWIEQAKLALKAGYLPKELVAATHGSLRIITWVGPESVRWEGWIQQFEQLCNHEDRQIREIGELGTKYSVQRRDAALKVEHDEAVYGYRRGVCD